jgi:hypothetical protein
VAVEELGILHRALPKAAFDWPGRSFERGLQIRHFR